MFYTGILYFKNIYGRSKKKLIYQCIPYDKELKPVLIPYEIKKYSFKKRIEPIYIVFRYTDEKKDYGIIVETIGTIDKKENYYLYEYYSHNLKKDSFSSYFPSNLLIKPIPEPNINQEIITIDPKGCKDFDDAISLRKEGKDITIISIYISNVPIFLEENHLWNYITKRYSSIYLPHKVIPMLPPSLSEKYCSLKEKENRYVFTIDFYIKDGKIISESYYPSIISVFKNYEYEEPSLLSNSFYQEIFKITTEIESIKDSHELIQFWMIKTNQLLSKQLKEGYKRITEKMDTNISSFEYKGKYISIDKEGEHSSFGLYTHITSPIRRIIDLINLTFLQKESFRKESLDIGYSFSIDSINEEIDRIKRVQNRSSWIEVLSNEKITEGKGIVFEKKENNIYSVFFKDLYLIKKFKSILPYSIGEEYRFHFFYFPMEGEWSKKFRIEPKE